VKKSLKTGFVFGLTSGIITTLGLMAGLAEGTHSKLAVLGGVLTIAVADALSDAAGMHVSEESRNKNQREVWEATLSTFASKLVFASTFAVPVILLDLDSALVVSVAWGLLLITVFNYYFAKQQKQDPVKVVGEHAAIALLVVVVAHFVGDLIAQYFG